MVKRLVYEMMEEPSRERANERNQDLFTWISQQPDATEGVRAFIEKRPPNWHLAKNGDFPAQFGLPEG
jgi:enoyl-CoA hydratase/carnithine racemase